MLRELVLVGWVDMFNGGSWRIAQRSSRSTTTNGLAHSYISGDDVCGEQRVRLFPREEELCERFCVSSDQVQLWPSDSSVRRPTRRLLCSKSSMQQPTCNSRILRLARSPWSLGWRMAAPGRRWLAGRVSKIRLSRGGAFAPADRAFFAFVDRSSPVVAGRSPWDATATAHSSPLLR
jgi:hypothetical protein